MNKEQSIRATFDIFKPDGVIEVRTTDGWSGYYRNREKLLQDLSRHKDKTWYFVMNDIKDACYSREQCEKLMCKKGLKTTSDKEISAVRWLLIDADPVRPSGVSSTDVEKDAALETTGRIYHYLNSVGFSRPVICDSGNGYHLLYSVKLPPSDSEHIHRFLKVLDMMFSNEAVSVDAAVFNPARITKVYGTMARKGASTAERPHRQSSIMSVPQEILLTSGALIKKVAAELPEPQKPTYSNGYSERFDIDSFIAKSGLMVRSDNKVGGTRKIVLEECPFDPSHKAPDSAIFVLDSGAVAFKCFHNSCQDKHWQDVRRLFDPQCYNRIQEQTRTCSTVKNEIPKTCPQTEPLGEHFLRLQDIEVIDRSKIVSIKTGVDALDKKIIGMNKGELSIWSGGNGSGKSTMLSQISLETIDRGFNVAMFSGELTSNRAKNWLQLQAAGRQNVRLSDNGVSYYVPKREADAIDAWTADRLWIYNNQYGTKAASVIDDFKRHIESHATDVVIIDNLMSLDLSDVKGEKYERQTLLVLQLSEMAKFYNVHIHFVCHPRKPVGFLRKADISGTADLTNAADNVFMLHRVNQDFMKSASEFLGKSEVEQYRKYSNVIEIMKNRDLGVADEFVGLYFEPKSKRLLNEEHENRCFGWEEQFNGGFTRIAEDCYNPFSES